MNKTIKLLTLLTCILFAGFMTACSDNDDTKPGGYTGEMVMGSTAETFAKSGGTKVVSVRSSSTLTVTSGDDSWCHVTAGTRTQFGVTPLTLVIDENDSYDDRSTVITVECDGEKSQIVVNQSSKEGLLVDQTVYEVPAAGGNVAVTLKATGDFTTNIGEGWVAEVSSRALKEYTRNFKVAENYGNARSTKITFTLGDLSESVTINQAAGASKSASEIAKQMFPGWNLGNTMEGGDSRNNWKNVGTTTETSWQSTKTTKEIIDFVASQGFKSVRIPTAWVMGHITDEANCTIDPEWMNRVQEVVDYCIADGLYVLLNDHWDGGWIEVDGFSASSASYQPVSEATIADKADRLKKIWTQIANHFKNYDQHLLFAGLNEPFQEYNLFSSRHKELTPILERYNQAFVDAVRATGGNNTARILVVQGPSTNIASTDAYLTLPNDPEAGRLMVEVHYYDPWNFCGGNSWLYWGNGNHVSGSSKNATYGEEDYVKAQMKLMSDKFTSKGVPVVIGEYAANWQSGSDEKHNASITAWYKCVTAECGNNGIVPFVWDINACTWPNMTILNRATKAVWNTPAMDGIKQGVAEAKWME